MLKKMKKAIFAVATIGVVSLSNVAYANPTPAHANCWDLAAQRFDVDAWLLFAIASRESNFTQGAIGNNKNGTQDLGIMQINTIHLNEMQRYGISRNDILHNKDCKGTYVSALLLKRCLNDYGVNIDGVGCYHSRTPHLRRKYGQAVLKEYNRLIDLHYIQKRPFNIRYAKK